MKVKVAKPIFGEAANQLVNITGKYSETILLKKEHWVVDAKSILGVLAISLQPGQEVELTVVDAPNEEILEQLIALGLFEK
ncbi:HPr family phosphocarrier protein [Caldalkalibacillus mannanilyticus]|uniref:HPr family phosphocarrier protein n=1 Tax=Caldalkalibacillus mannanilyticus TaxID=1418 RepID=UPI000468A0EA|nr:HPr family phosphocarrier protein [Caldalkalibacillus mannanilyticus]